MTEINNIDNRVSIIETKMDHLLVVIEDIKKKLENLELSNIMTKLALLEQKLSIVQWVWWLLASWVMLYIVSWVMRII